jgi:sulfite reductase (NADPH) flavoprotein alpha-component
MISESKKALVQQLTQQTSNDELIWLSGYFAGLADKTGSATTVAEPAAVAIKPTIIYGTETGNSKKVASQLLAGFKKNKIQAKAVDAFQYDVTKLEKEEMVFFVMSTQGEGEFPQNAVAFYEKLSASKANLSKVKFAVLGLGDSSYPLFCQAGVLLDEALGNLGAERILPLVKADVDFSQNVIDWENELKALLQNTGIKTAIATVVPKAVEHKKHYKGIIEHKIILNDRGSNKETYHIEIASNDEIYYEPGDALGVVPINSEKEIQEIIGFFKDNGERKISVKNQEETVHYFLSHRNIKGLSKKSVEQLAEFSGLKIDAEKADLIDFLNENKIPETVTLEKIIEILLPIAPRLYSISSSKEAHDGQVHLTVTLNKFQVGKKTKSGLASQFLADFPLHTELDFYIHKNNNFRLPEDENTPIIMIGPGTGIAPFRSFIAHRDATGAEGKNWLFFGEQHFVSDFYYQTEIQEWISTGVLSQFDVAFSRDQKEKIYVQDRIRQNGKEFNEWLESGASLYICGQKSPMSTDVETAILDVLMQERNIDKDAAVAVLDQLETEGKYQKDVY